MGDSKPLKRIHMEPKIQTGESVIPGTRIPVDFILGPLAHGAKVQEILDKHKGLVGKDVLACLLACHHVSRRV